MAWRGGHGFLLCFKWYIQVFYVAASLLRAKPMCCFWSASLTHPRIFPDAGSPAVAMPQLGATSLEPGPRPWLERWCAKWRGRGSETTCHLLGTEALEKHESHIGSPEIPTECFLRLQPNACEHFERPIKLQFSKCLGNRGVNKIELLLLDSFLCGFHQTENESCPEFTRSIRRLQLSHEALSLIFTSHSSKNLRANEHRSCWGAAKCARSVWVEIPSHGTIWWNETLWQKYKNMLWCRLRHDVVLFHVCGASCIGNAKDSVIASLASPSSSTTKDANGCTEKAQKKAASWKSSGEEWLLIKISRQTSPRNTGVYLGNSIWHNVGCRKKAPGLVAYLNVTIPEKRC